MGDQSVSQAAAKKPSLAIYARVKKPQRDEGRSTTSLDPGPPWGLREKDLA